MLQSPEEGKGDKETAGAAQGGVPTAAALPLLLPPSLPNASVGCEAPQDTRTRADVRAPRGDVWVLGPGKVSSSLIASELTPAMPGGCWGGGKSRLPHGEGRAGAVTPRFGVGWVGSLRT